MARGTDWKLVGSSRGRGLRRGGEVSGEVMMLDIVGKSHSGEVMMRGLKASVHACGINEMF